MESLEKFETIICIKNILSRGYLEFDHDKNEYVCRFGGSFGDCQLVNIAWSVFQQQEDEICKLYAAINDALDGFEDGEFNYCHKALRKALGDVG